jgi:hypothetical protein
MQRRKRRTFTRQSKADFHAPRRAVSRQQDCKAVSRALGTGTWHDEIIEMLDRIESIRSRTVAGVEQELGVSCWRST